VRWDVGASEAGSGNAGTRSRRRVLLTILAIAASVAAAALGALRAREWLLTSPRFAIEAVRIEGARLVPADSVEAASGIARASNLFRLDRGAAERRLAAHPWIASARVTRRPPRTAVVEVVERRPVALLAVGAWQAIDGEGRLIPISAIGERLELPLVTGCFLSDGLDTGRLKRAAEFLRAVETQCDFLLRDVSEVHVGDPEDLLIYTVKSGTAVHLGAPAYEEKLERLLLVLEDLSGREAVPLSIDLRFDGQAIVRFRGA
jgi:cell division protein FtsQ